MIRNAIMLFFSFTLAVRLSVAGNPAAAIASSSPFSGIKEYFQNTAEDDSCELFIPNAFSPDGDGINDFFKIRCIEHFPQAKLEVFNRWGTLVFSKEEYGNEPRWGESDAWWDGSANRGMKTSGGKLPAGTYFYIFNPGDNSALRKGTVFLNY